VSTKRDSQKVRGTGRSLSQNTGSVGRCLAFPGGEKVPGGAFPPVHPRCSRRCHRWCFSTGHRSISISCFRGVWNGAGILSKFDVFNISTKKWRAPGRLRRRLSAGAFLHRSIACSRGCWRVWDRVALGTTTMSRPTVFNALLINSSALTRSACRQTASPEGDPRIGKQMHPDPCTRHRDIKPSVLRTETADDDGAKVITVRPERVSIAKTAARISVVFSGSAGP
jgi:hypothetical protein